MKCAGTTMRIWSLRQANKCHCAFSEVRVLGLVIGPDQSAIDFDGISSIVDWPTLESFRDLQVLLGTIYVYQWFIWKRAQSTMSISDRLQNAESTRMSEQVNWEWTWDAELTFRTLK